MITIKKTTVFLSLFFCLILSQTISFATTDTQSYCWENMKPVNKPPVQDPGGDLVFDSESGVALFFDDNLKNVWVYSFEENNWTSTYSPEMPDGGISPTSAAYDSTNDITIFFGLNTGPGYAANETWSYDYNSNHWVNLTTTGAPPKRVAGAFVYDSNAEKFILISGINRLFIEPYEYFQDVWTYDYLTNVWTNVTPSINPPSRWESGSVYDPVADKTIIFGGMRDLNDGSWGLAANDTWIFDLTTTTWTQLETVNTPPRRSHFNMIYNDEKDITMLFGGGQENNWFSDTWIFEYESKTWTELNCTNHPLRRWDSFLTYNTITHEALLYGGKIDNSPLTLISDTWIFTYDETCDCFPEKTDYSFLSVTVVILLLGNLILIVRRRKKI